MPCHMQYKAIIFDLDGTLIHSAPDLQNAMNNALEKLGRDTLELGTIISFIGNGVEKLIARSLAATGASSPDLQNKALALFLEFYEAHSVAQTRPFPGVVAFLKKLKERDVSLGICTNKPTEPARKICDALDLSDFFDVISGAEPDQPKKPDPSPLLNCAAALGATPDQTLYIGDSDVDSMTALNANITFAFFTGGYLNGPLAAPGPAYRFSDWSDDSLLRYCCGGA